jgi:hypothetical protein
MKQTFGQTLPALFCEIECGQGIECITLLRSASPIPSSNYGNPFGASMLGNGALRLELFIEGCAQPVPEDPMAHGEQGLVAWRVANLG